jgi:hypothetical protein
MNQNGTKLTEDCEFRSAVKHSIHYSAKSMATIYEEVSPRFPSEESRYLSDALRKVLEEFVSEGTVGTREVENFRDAFGKSMKYYLVVEED